MIIALIGPHAIGKTTAVQRWSDYYPHIRMVACDNGRAFDGLGWEEKQPGWLRSSDEKIAAATRCAESPYTWVCEGNTARNMPWLKVVKCKVILHTFCSPEKFAQLMRARCNRNKKEYREDYWSDQILAYEASGRFKNAERDKKLATKNVLDFVIDNQETDWEPVDEIFNQLAGTAY